MNWAYKSPARGFSVAALRILVRFTICFGRQDQCSAARAFGSMPNPRSLGGEHGIVRLRRLLLLAVAVIMRRGRQLQHGCGLAGNQPRHHHDLTAGKFQRVMMDMWVIHIDLAETS